MIPTLTTNRFAQATRSTSNSRLNVFFADEVPSPKSTPPKKETTNTKTKTTTTTTSSDNNNNIIKANVEMVTSDQEGFLNMAGAFLVDAFWLNSEHHQIMSNSQTLSDDVRLGLIVEQCADLQERYGERMGKRLLEASVLAALDNDDDNKSMVGLATLKSTLMVRDDVLESEMAETMAHNAVATLGPKQRRQYKDASIQTIASELLGPDVQAVCVLSNLAVSPNARRRGIAQQICYEAEALAQDWGFDALYLIVEKENHAARQLYETKLGFSVISTKENDVALRADTQDGTFVEISVDSLVLSKKLV